MRALSHLLRLDVCCLLAFRALLHVKADFLAFLERLDTFGLNFGEMRKQVFAPVVRPCCCSRAAEVAARPAISNVERGLVLENKPFNDATILDGKNGAPVHKHAGALVRKNELH